MKSSTYVVEASVTPIPGSDGAQSASDAYANVFLLAASDQEALDRAKAELHGAGWFADEVAEVRSVTKGSFDDPSIGLERFEQCQIDGVVIELHTWRSKH